jgi:hypothetical protein
MDRRGFLGAISAFVAATTAGVRMPSGAEAASSASALAAPVPPPQAKKPVADPSRAIALQDNLLSEIRGFSVVSYREEIGYDGRRLVLEYVHGGPSLLTGKQHADLVSYLRPVGVTISGKSTVVSSAGELSLRFVPGPRTVTVEYA